MTVTYKNPAAQPPVPTMPKSPSGEPDLMFHWSDLVGTLLASRHITEGWWRVGVKMRFAALTTQMTELGKEPASLPTALIGIEGVAMFEVTEGGDMVYDAATGKPVLAGTAQPATDVTAKPVGRKRVTLRKR